MITVLDMVESSLRGLDCDGLFNEHIECGCTIGDIEPCGEISGDCEAGYNNPERAADEGVDSWIQRDRP